MPVRNWMIRSVREALPKTYHQPIGPAAPLGMGWVSIGRMLSRKPSRASNHSPRVRSRRFITFSPLRLVVGTQRVLQGRVVRRLDLELPGLLVDPPFAAEQAARRRT